MDVYEYIAHENPDMAIAVLAKYGHTVSNVKDSSDLAGLLKEFVKIHGEDGLKSLLAVHPDKEIILGTFQENGTLELQRLRAADATTSTAAPCTGCNKLEKMALAQAVNNSTSVSQQASQSSQAGNLPAFFTQTNTFLIIGSLVIAAAIILKKN